MNLTNMIETGAANPVVLFAVALVLGALHGLEPGHSKTMMAAYIIAVRGTVGQAVLLGLSAAFSHVIIVWVLAILALTWGNELIGEALEPYFMIASGILILGIAGWMLMTSLRDRARRNSGHSHVHSHVHSHGHGHSHAHPAHDHHHPHHSHEHGSHAHDHQSHSHGSHSHAPDPHAPNPHAPDSHAPNGHHSHHHRDHGHGDNTPGGDQDLDGHLDAHARAHAAEIRSRVASGRTGTWQTVLFGLSGGLIPCPAAITVAILCLHLGKLALGVTLVSAFSIGLAATLVAIGVVAALGLSYAAARTQRLDAVMAMAPWISGALIALVGLLIIFAGAAHLGGHH